MDVKPCLDIIRLCVSTWFPNTTTVHLDMNIVRNSKSFSKILVTKSLVFPERTINRTLQCCMCFFFVKLCCFSSRTSAATFTTGWTTATVRIHYIRSTWRHLSSESMTVIVGTRQAEMNSHNGPPPRQLTAPSAAHCGAQTSKCLLLT